MVLVNILKMYTVVGLTSDSLELTALFYEDNACYFRIYNCGEPQEVNVRIGNMFLGIVPCNIDKTVCGNIIIAKDGICKDYLTKNQVKTYMLKV